jgi:hypothetical protein
MDVELTQLKDAVWKALEQVNLTTGALLAKVEEKIKPVTGQTLVTPVQPEGESVPTTEGTESV